MHIHRTSRTRFFTTLGNDVLRDSRLSFCARGVLGYLLSLPDGQRGDIRTLANRAPEGRERIASALRELERHGYLRREVRRTVEGRLYTEVDVFDSPCDTLVQVAPRNGFPGSGAPQTTPHDDHPGNEPDEETTRPPSEMPADAQAGRAGDDPEETVASVELLTRVSRAEPRLNLGPAEALALAPLVAQWRRRGASDLHIVGSLTAGLPSVVHAPAALVADRLKRKMPAERAPTRARIECDGCGVPVAVAGRCRRCRSLGPERSGPSIDFAQVRARGAVMARAALRGVPVGALASA